MFHRALIGVATKISLITGITLFASTPEGQEKTLQMLQFALKEGIAAWNLHANNWNNNPTARYEMIKGAESLLRTVVTEDESVKPESMVLIQAASEIEEMPVIEQIDTSKIHIIMPNSDIPIFEVEDLDALSSESY